MKKEHNAIYKCSAFVEIAFYLQISLTLTHQQWEVSLNLKLKLKNLSFFVIIYLFIIITIFICTYMSFTHMLYIWHFCE